MNVLIKSRISVFVSKECTIPFTLKDGKRTIRMLENQPNTLLISLYSLGYFCARKVSKSSSLLNNFSLSSSKNIRSFSSVTSPPTKGICCVPSTKVRSNTVRSSPSLNVSISASLSI